MGREGAEREYGQGCAPIAKSAACSAFFADNAAFCPPLRFAKSAARDMALASEARLRAVRCLGLSYDHRKRAVLEAVDIHCTVTCKIR